jgi:hypothetical protein
MRQTSQAKAVVEMEEGTSRNDRHEGASAPSFTFDQNGSR